VAGLLTALAVFGAIVAFAPEPEPATPGPSIAAASPGPSPSAAAPSPVAPPSEVPSAAIGPSGSPEPSGTGSPEPSALAGTGLFHIGESAPPLLVPQLGGGTIDLSALRGRPVWVNFWATWCPTCRDEFGAMNGFAARYAEQGLVILAIDVREDEGLVASFASDVGAVFPIGLDADGAAAGDWGAVALPVHFWVDASGVVRDGAAGGIGPDIMARGLGSILPGVTVTP
jgi:thiol-disulfide isomerase/thioredoxin